MRETCKESHPRNAKQITVSIPWHCQCVTLILLATCSQSCSTWWSTTNTYPQDSGVTTVLFPHLLSVQTVGAIRILFASVICADCVYAVLYGSWDQQTVYDKDRSKLKGITIPFRGIFRHPTFSIFSGLATLSSFTMVSWIVLGLSFFFAGISAYQAGENNIEDIPRWWIQAALILWQCAAPSAVLVSTTVKYVLWPMALQYESSNAEVFAHPLTLLEHNGNSIMVLTEMTLLGGLPLVRIEIVVLFGIAYVVLSWLMMHRWSTDGSPQFLYPFFDVTLGWRTTVYLLVLLLALVTYYGMIASVSQFLNLYSNCLDGHLGILVLVSGVLVTCRWRN